MLFPHLVEDSNELSEAKFLGVIETTREQSRISQELGETSKLLGAIRRDCCTFSQETGRDQPSNGVRLGELRSQVSGKISVLLLCLPKAQHKRDRN